MGVGFLLTSVLLCMPSLNLIALFKEDQTVFFYVFFCEFDRKIFIVEVGLKHFQFFCLNIDPGVIKKSGPVAWNSSCEGWHGFFFVNLLHTL